MATSMTQQTWDMSVDVRPVLRRVQPSATEAVLDARFRSEILPLLTPVVLDRAHPLPFLGLGAKGLIVRFGRSISPRYGVVLIHPALAPFVETPDGQRIPLEHVVASHVAELFGRLSVEGCWTFGIASGGFPEGRPGNEVAAFLVTALQKTPRCRRAHARMTSPEPSRVTPAL